MTNASRIVELDYDALKLNLIAFFQSTPEFSDYNFTGSALTTLINSLAYNSHYLGFYASMGNAEKFLDSAVTRSAVISAAKSMGYIPASITSALATVDVSVSNAVGSPSVLELPKYSIFTATVTNSEVTKTFNFVNTETYTTTKIGNVHTFTNVVLKEGNPLLNTFVVGDETSFIYEIPNDNVDTASIKVRVQKSSSDMTSTAYTKYAGLSGVNADSKIFFIEENYKGKIQLQFGDGIIGTRLDSGNIIIVEYISTTGKEANGVNSFVLSAAVFGSAVVITTTTGGVADGGADTQSIQSIKFSAPKAYVAQNRLVTTNDFYAEVASISSIESVSVWGGEDNVPPSYGRVFISAKPIGSLYLSDSLKNDILLNKLKPKKVATIIPTFVDPDYTYINLHVTAKYDRNVNNLGIGDMESLVRGYINSFQTTQLGKFNAEFLYESFLSYIKDSNTSIVSTYAITKLQKRFRPNLNVTSDHTIEYYTELQPNKLESTKFYIFVDDTLRFASIRDVAIDDQSGTLDLWDVDSKSVYQTNIGTVDYVTGTVVINPIVINSLVDIEDIRVTVSVHESVFDIDTYRNNILIFDDSYIDTNNNLKNGVTIDIIKV